MKKVRRLYHCSYARVSVPEKELDALESALAEAVELLREMRDPHDDYGLRVEDFLDKHGGEGA